MRIPYHEIITYIKIAYLRFSVSFFMNLSYKVTSENTKVNVVRIGVKLKYITRDEMMTHLRHTVDNLLGLGFTGANVGTHSFRASPHRKLEKNNY